MSRVWWILVAAAACATAASAFASSPRDAREHFNAPDTKLAQTAVVHPSNLVGDWRALVTPASHGAERCSGFNPDLSRFTITGTARSSFQSGIGAIVSTVDVFDQREAF